jgi:hypothetical protein
MARLALSSLFLLAAACSPKVNAPCAVEADCSAGMICQDGLCADSALADAGPQCTSSLDCSEDGTRCREGRCVPIGGDAGVSPDAGNTAGGCGNGPACSDRVFGGQAVERCIDGTCRQGCLSDVMCRSPEAPICIEVEGANSCMPGQCERNNDCDEGQVCQDSRCLDVTFCDDDSNCAANEICNGDGFCQERDRCLVDNDCEDDSVCNNGFCFEAPSCADGQPCPEGLDCVGERCVEGICRSADDCENDQICSAGTCQDRPQREPHRIVIVTPYGICAGGGENACTLPLAIGATAQLTAMALDVNGHGIAGFEVQWSSDAANRARISADGLVTAAAAGEARIDAVAGQLSADRTVRVQVEPAPVEDAILVLDERGAGLDNARVAVKQGDAAWRYMPGPTHNGGRLTLDRLAQGDIGISVFAEGYEQTMVVGLNKGNDPLRVILPMMRDRSSRAAGFRARVDFSNVSSQGDGQLSLSGASVPDLLGFDLTAFAGDTFTGQLAIPGRPAMSVPLPGGITFTATVFTFPINLKDTAYARGAAGLRSAWSFAGRVDPVALFGRFQGLQSPSDAVLAIFPMLAAFEHGLVAGLPLVEQDLIADAADINGNNDRNEMVPDWQNFALTEFRPSTRQNGRTHLSIPAAAGAEGTVLTGGIFHPGTGYTPLGMSAHEGTDAAELPFTIAPAYGGLEGHDYVFAVMAISDQGSSLRTQIRRSPRLDNAQPFGAHLNLPQVETRSGSIVVAASAGAHLIRVLASGRDGALRVYAKPGAQANVTINPAPGPNGAQQRIAQGTVELISLTGLPGGDALSHLVNGQGMVLSSVGMHARGFSRVSFGQ